MNFLWVYRKCRGDNKKEKENGWERREEWNLTGALLGGLQAWQFVFCMADGRWWSARLGATRRCWEICAPRFKRLPLGRGSPTHIPYFTANKNTWHPYRVVKIITFCIKRQNITKKKKKSLLYEAYSEHAVICVVAPLLTHLEAVREQRRGTKGLNSLLAA